MSFPEAVEGGKCEEDGLCIGAESLDCDNLERPSRGDDTDLTSLKEARKEFREKILQCVCCNDASLEELTEGLVKGGAGRVGKGKLTQELVDKKCDTGTVDCPVDLSCDDIERPEKSEFMTDEGTMNWAAMKEALKQYRQTILSCACCTNNSLEDLGVPSMNGGRVQHILEKRCPAFQDKCPAVSSECTRLGSDNVSWEERRQNLLECVCCREDGVEAIDEGGDVQSSVLLASLMADESAVQTEESYSASSAASLSFVLSSFVVLAGVIAFV